MRSFERAAVLHQAHPATPLVLLTTDVPGRGTPGDAALRAVLGPGRPVHGVVQLLDAEDRDRLRRWASAADQV